MKIPRILIAGTHSGVGKTTMTLALLLALRESGLRVQPFKAGPDYIDPGFLGQAAGRPCRNLDSWLVPANRVPQLFVDASAGAGMALIEGVMGLYDGTDAVREKGSTGELAKKLGCPVLLVIDAGGLSRSAAAIASGFRGLDRKIRIAGVLANRLAGEGHYRLVKQAVEKLAGLPVVGWLPRDAEITLPERHLGLVPAAEKRDLPAVFARLRKRALEGLDLPAIRRIAEKAPVMLSLSKHDPFPIRQAQGERAQVPIAVAQDEAFHFYYPENLELLNRLGAELVPFSPLRSARLPRGIGALYLGGGFPEIFAGALARNRKLQDQVRGAITGGMPAYAECGGLMYLAHALRDGKGRRHRMAGVLPGEVRMTGRLQNFGYKQLTARKDSLLARKGEKGRGHEFHHSVWGGFTGGTTAAYDAASASGAGPRPEGYSRGNLVASYVHLHFWSQPRWAERFVTAARRFNNHQTDEKGKRCLV